MEYLDVERYIDSYTDLHETTFELDPEIESLISDTDEFKADWHLHTKSAFIKNHLGNKKLGTAHKQLK